MSQSIAAPFGLVAAKNGVYFHTFSRVSLKPGKMGSPLLLKNVVSYHRLPSFTVRLFDDCQFCLEAGSVPKFLSLGVEKKVRPKKSCGKSRPLSCVAGNLNRRQSHSQRRCKKVQSLLRPSRGIQSLGGGFCTDKTRVSIAVPMEAVWNL